MTDAVLHAFLTTARQEVRNIREQSEIVRLVADPMSGEPPARYHGLFTDIEHFERSATGIYQTSSSAIPFTIEIPYDYCRSVDASLIFRIVRIRDRVVHPNVSASGVLCLGGRFRPGTRMRPLIEQVYRILSGQVVATESPLDAEASRFYLRHPERVRTLTALPLWRQPVAARVHVETLKAQNSSEGTCS